MALNTVTITKNGSGFEMVGYSNNGATSLADLTVTNPTGVKLFANGDIITIDPVDIAPWIFDQSANPKAKNHIISINGVDVSAYTTAQVLAALNAAFATGFSNGVPIMAQNGVILNLTTNNSDGTAFVAFADSPCNSLDVVNSSGTALEYRRNGAGLTMYMPDNSARNIPAITNANQISVRRIDVSATPVTITAEAITA